MTGADGMYSAQCAQIVLANLSIKSSAFTWSRSVLHLYLKRTVLKRNKREIAILIRLDFLSFEEIFKNDLFNLCK